MLFTWNSNLMNCRTLVFTAAKICRASKSERNSVGTSVGNMKGKLFAVVKIHCLFNHTIFIKTPQG